MVSRLIIKLRLSSCHTQHAEIIRSIPYDQDGEERFESPNAKPSETLLPTKCNVHEWWRMHEICMHCEILDVMKAAIMHAWHMCPGVDPTTGAKGAPAESS